MPGLGVVARTLNGPAAVLGVVRENGKIVVRHRKV